MNIAKAIHIHKSGDRDLFFNYRTIAPSSQKILEKIFVKRLYNYIEKYTVLSDY